MFPQPGIPPRHMQHLLHILHICHIEIPSGRTWSLGPKVCPRSPKCLQNGCQREPWRVPKNVFVSTSVKKVPTSPKPHYLLCFVKVCPWPKPRILLILDPQNDIKINKNQNPHKIHSNCTLCRVLWAQVRKSSENGGQKGLQFGPEITPNLNKSPPGPPDGPQTPPNGPKPSFWAPKCFSGRVPP